MTTTERTAAALEMAATYRQPAAGLLTASNRTVLPPIGSERERAGTARLSRDLRALGRLCEQNAVVGAESREQRQS